MCDKSKKKGTVSVLLCLDWFSSHETTVGGIRDNCENQ